MSPRHASTEPDAPDGNLVWLSHRCNDTMRMPSDVQASSFLDLIDSFARDLREYPTVVPQPLLRAALNAPGDAAPFALLRLDALALALPGSPRWESVTFTGPLEHCPSRPAHVASDELASRQAFALRLDQLLSSGIRGSTSPWPGCWTTRCWSWWRYPRIREPISTSCPSTPRDLQRWRSSALAGESRISS